MDTKFTVREELNNLINAIAEINNEPILVTGNNG